MEITKLIRKVLIRLSILRQPKEKMVVEEEIKEVELLKISINDLIDKNFVVSDAPTGKVYICRLCGIHYRSEKTVAKHWKTNHQSNIEILLD